MSRAAPKIRVDRDACRGSGACVRRAPGTFRLDGERRSVVEESPRDPLETIRAAAEACPFFAITVEEIDGP